MSQEARKVIDIDDIEITVRELSVEAIRALMLPAPRPDNPTAEQVAEYNLDMALFEDCRLSDLLALSSLTHKQIQTMRPSQLRRVIDACKEMNKDFFAMLGRVTA